jgi:hypothetical protein
LSSLNWDQAQYRQFWEGLRRGEFQAGEFPRIAKGGRQVWIQAFYNPLLNRSGKPFKIEIRSRHHRAEAAQRRL